MLSIDNISEIYGTQFAASSTLYASVIDVSEHNLPAKYAMMSYRAGTLRPAHRNLPGGGDPQGPQA
jgi:hypothetical protein